MGWLFFFCIFFVTRVFANPEQVTSICICFWIRQARETTNFRIRITGWHHSMTPCHPWKWNFPKCLTHWNDLPAVNDVLKNVCMNLCVKISCKIIRAKKLKFVLPDKSHELKVIRTCEHSVFWMSCWIYCCSWNWQYCYWYKNFFLPTVYPRSFDPFYIESYNINGSRLIGRAVLYWIWSRCLARIGSTHQDQEIFQFIIINFTFIFFTISKRVKVHCVRCVILYTLEMKTTKLAHFKY